MSMPSPSRWISLVTLGFASLAVVAAAAQQSPPAPFPEPPSSAAAIAQQFSLDHMSPAQQLALFSQFTLTDEAQADLTAVAEFTASAAPAMLSSSTDVASVCEDLDLLAGRFDLGDIPLACAEYLVEGDIVQIKRVDGPSIVTAPPGSRACSVIGEIGASC